MSKLTRFDPLDDLFRGFFVRPVEMNTPAEVPAIRMDVSEQPKCFLVQVDGNQVSITAEVKQEKEVREGERVLRAERYFGQVSRTFQLAQDINDSEASARFNDGVLELTLPKKAASASKRLTID